MKSKEMDEVVKTGEKIGENYMEAELLGAKHPGRVALDAYQLNPKGGFNNVLITDALTDGGKHESAFDAYLVYKNVYGQDRKKTYVHTKLPQQVPYYQSIGVAAPIIPGYETHENQEIQNMGVLIIGVLIFGAAVKAIQTFGKFFQNANPKENTEAAKQH